MCFNDGYDVFNLFLIERPLCSLNNCDFWLIGIVSVGSISIRRRLASSSVVCMHESKVPERSTKFVASTLAKEKQLPGPDVIVPYQPPISSRTLDPDKSVADLNDFHCLRAFQTQITARPQSLGSLSCSYTTSCKSSSTRLSVDPHDIEDIVRRLPCLPKILVAMSVIICMAAMTLAAAPPSVQRKWENLYLLRLRQNAGLHKTLSNFRLS